MKGVPFLLKLVYKRVRGVGPQITVHLCYEVPQLFQENLQNSSLSIELQRLVIHSHDAV